MQSAFEQHILEQAKAGKLPGIFRRMEPEEGSVHCVHHMGIEESTPEHCLRVVKPGDLVPGYTTCENYSKWSEEARTGADGIGDGHPDCLHCEVKNIAEGLIQDLRDGKPMHSRAQSDLELMLSGYVDIEAVEKDVYTSHPRNPFIIDEWIGVFFFIWHTEAAEFDLSRLTGDHDVGAVESAIGDWMKARRRRGRELAEEALASSREGCEYGRQCDQSYSTLLLDYIEMAGVEVPERALHFLEGFANTPKYRIKGLLRMKRWMEFMAKPGPKVVFRKGGVEKAMPYPEESQKQAAVDLARIEQEIEKLQAELSR